MVPPTNNKGHSESKIYLCAYRYIHTCINDRQQIDLIKHENSTNLVTLNYENMKVMAFLKHIKQKICVEAGKNEF
jgi:hypothetical protein